MEIHTIGFTRHRASNFFGKLRTAGIDRLIDVRLSNTSQLAGFAKRDDLAWLLSELCDVRYQHVPLLAPSKELLTQYQNKTIDWEEYETRFIDLMTCRHIEDHIDPDSIGERPVLLCSEHSAERCHRRLVAEYLRNHWDLNVSIRHL